MERFFSFEGGKIHYSDSGEGSAIVLLHGYLESLEVWNGFGQKLARKFRVISIDLPGHGLSDVYGETHSMEFMALSVRSLIDNSKIGKVVMAGHSLGGYVTMAFLELFPEKLRGYCLFHSHPFADTMETIEKRKREIRIVREGKKNIIYPENLTRMFANLNIEKFQKELEQLKSIASKLSDNGIIAVLNGMMSRPSRLSIMEDGKVPCLWILGLMDNYINSDLIRKNVSLPENVKVLLLENSGHMGFIEEEERSVEAITAFVEKLRVEGESGRKGEHEMR